MAHNDMAEPSTTTPLSPRVSDVSNGSRYLRDNDFLESPIRSPASVVSVWGDSKRPHSKLRHAVGIALLLATVVLWTVSNFLASVRSLLYLHDQVKRRITTLHSTAW